MQAIFPVNRGRLVAETGTVEGRIEEITGGIPGEHTPGAVRAMRARRQPHYHGAGLYISKPRHRLAPIIPIAKGSPFLARHLFAPCHQARAFTAGEHFLLVCFPIHKLPLTLNE
jgi:hypothetical protein